MPDSQNNPPLHEADADWLRQLAGGMTWLALGIWASIAFGAITTGISIGMIGEAYMAALEGEPADLENLTPPWFNTVIALGIAALSAVFLVGTWKITKAEPGKKTVTPSLATTKWTCLPAFAINIPASLALLGAGNAVIAIGSLGIKLIAVALLSVGFPASLLYMRYLANRIPDFGLAKQTTIVFWGQFIAGLLLIVCMVVLLGVVVMEYQRNAGLDLGFWVLWIMLPGVAAIVLFFVWWVWLMMLYRSKLARTCKTALPNPAT